MGAAEYAKIEAARRCRAQAHFDRVTVTGIGASPLAALRSAGRIARDGGFALTAAWSVEVIDRWAWVHVGDGLTVGWSPREGRGRRFVSIPEKVGASDWGLRPESTSARVPRSVA